VFGTLTADGYNAAVSGFFNHEPLTERILGRHPLATSGIGTGGRQGRVLVWTCHCLLPLDRIFLHPMYCSLTLPHFAVSQSFLLTLLVGISLGIANTPLLSETALWSVSPPRTRWCRLRARHALSICLEGEDEKLCTWFSFLSAPLCNNATPRTHFCPTLAVSV
jgi:hypothetical protein